MSTAAEVARQLLQINAIKLSPQKPFTWASGIKSPIYCDNRVALSYPEVRAYITEHLVKASADFHEFDAIAGVATAGIPHGAILADRLGMPFAYVRSKAKSHGRQNLIEGSLKEGSKVLVIEDLISTGGSSLQAVQALREAGCEVVGVLAIFTYEFNSSVHAFAEADCPLHTLSAYTALLNEAVAQNHITDEQLETLQSWREHPETWTAAE
jgi:orotate phosphoribosyltransferase